MHAYMRTNAYIRTYINTRMRECARPLDTCFRAYLLCGVHMHAFMSAQVHLLYMLSSSLLSPLTSHLSPLFSLLSSASSIRGSCSYRLSLRYLGISMR